MSNNYAMPYTMQQMNPLRQIQDMFPQPQGSVYQLNTPSEIGNVPIGSTGLSVAICFSEQIMYIKSFQNGSPVIMAFRIAPFTRETKEPEAEQSPTADPLEERFSRIESQLAKILQMQNSGGKLDELL